MRSVAKSDTLERNGEDEGWNGGLVDDGCWMRNARLPMCVHKVYIFTSIT